jgi:hypothetical protein
MRVGQEGEAAGGRLPLLERIGDFGGQLNAADRDAARD